MHMLLVFRIFKTTVVTSCIIYDSSRWSQKYKCLLYCKYADLLSLTHLQWDSLIFNIQKQVLQPISMKKDEAIFFL